MPVITEAHVIRIHDPYQARFNNDIPIEDLEASDWENFLVSQNKTLPQRYKVHLVVSGFQLREDARAFAENFMANGSLFVFGRGNRPVFRLEVEQAGNGENYVQD